MSTRTDTLFPYTTLFRSRVLSSSPWARSCSKPNSARARRSIDMIDKLLDASIRFRWGVVILTLIISAYGLSELLKLPIDAVPDITNKQVQINTVEPHLGPLDIERLVTFTVETALAGIPGTSGKGQFRGRVCQD